MKAILMFTLFAVLTISAGAQDFSNTKGWALTGKAWEATKQGNHELVLAYTNKCIDKYLKKAKKMQASLTSLPTGDKKAVNKYAALNDVGVCLLIKGESQLKNGDKADALATFKILAELSYAQCWDKKGWFWQPAKAAKKQIAKLQ